MTDPAEGLPVCLLWREPAGTDEQAVRTLHVRDVPAWTCDLGHTGHPDLLRSELSTGEGDALAPKQEPRTVSALLLPDEPPANGLRIRQERLGGRHRAELVKDALV